MAYGVRKGDASDGFNFDTFSPSDSLGMDSLRQFMDALSGYQMDDAMADAAASDALNAAQGFAQASDQTRASCAAMGKDFDPVLQVCIPPKEGSTVLGGAGATLADALEDLAGVKIPGLLDIPGIGDAVNSGLGGIADIFDGISEYTGIGGDWAKDVILGPDGVVVVIRDPNQPSQNTGGGAVQTQSGNTTVSVDTGSAAGNVLLTGGTLGEMGGLGSGEGTDTEFIMRGVCAVQGREYDENTGLCKQAPPSQPPGGSTAGGTTTTGGGGADDDDDEDASTTVTIGGSTATQTDPCDDPDYAAANPLECLVVGPNTGDGTPAGGVGPIQQKMCPNGELVDIDAKCPIVDPPGGDTKTCPDGSEVDINEDCPGITPITKECWDGSVVGIDEDCPGTTPITKECWDGSVVDINDKCPDKPLGPGPDPEPEPDCTDPVYALENPVECGNVGPETPPELPPLADPCDDPDYAAANPVECGGGEELNFCDDPAYAAANPEKCSSTIPPDGEETIPSLCGDEVYAMLNPEICGASPQYSMPGGGGTFVSTEPGEIAEKGYYDIGMESGVFGPNDLLSEVETILRGR